MSGADHLYFEWWTDDAGWLWVLHDCNGTVQEWRPPPPWQTNDQGGVSPSFDCKTCGRHTILTAADNRDRLDSMGASRIERPPVPARVTDKGDES